MTLHILRLEGPSLILLNVSRLDQQKGTLVAGTEGIVTLGPLCAGSLNEVLIVYLWDCWRHQENRKFQNLEPPYCASVNLRENPSGFPRACIKHTGGQVRQERLSE